MAGTIKTSVARRFVTTKARSSKDTPPKAKNDPTTVILEIEPKTIHSEQIEMPIVSPKQKIKRERPPGATCAAALHALQDATVQTEMFKWVYDPMYPRYSEWTLMGFLIKNAELEERRHDKRSGESNFRSFDQEKLKPDIYSQKLIREDAARRKRRQPSLQAADGMLWRGTYPVSLLQKNSGIIVVNGVWPDETT